MDVSEIIVGAAAGLASVAAALAAAYPQLRKARAALAPLLGRRDLRVVVLVDQAHETEAVAFAATLRVGGYREVVVTRSPWSAAGAGVVVVWHPGPAVAQDACLDAESAAPEAMQLVLTHERLDIKLGERRLLANSVVRLRSDLATLAEQAR